MLDTINRIITSVLRCRAIDLHEQRLADAGTPLAHQFSAAGHELAQAMVAVHMTDPDDGVFTYYRSKCAWLCAGLSVDAYVQSAFQNAGSYANGRNFSVLPYARDLDKPNIAPVFGGVGSQYEPAIGWARSLKLVPRSLESPSPLTFVFGGDGSVSTVGFWSAIREVSAFQLPMIIVIENNGVALSTPSAHQITGGLIADSLASFVGLDVHSFDGTDPANIPVLQSVIESARKHPKPTLIELTVPRLAGHSGGGSKQNTEGDSRLGGADDPVVKLRTSVLESGQLDAREYDRLEALADQEVTQCFTSSLSTETIQQNQFTSPTPVSPNRSIKFSHPYGANKVSIAHAVNAWLASALACDDRVMLLGEDIGQLGGVHGVTRGLQTKYGSERVIDSSLNESSIVGQAMGLAMAGMRPIVEIQYRKYLDPAMEQFHNIGWCDWLTNGQFQLPVIIRVPFGIGGQSDPWHSESNEAAILRAIGYDVACPSSANDAVDVLTQAYQSSRPTVILEHRGLYYSSLSRERLPASDSHHKESVGRRRSTVLREGSDVTIVSWGKLCRDIEAIANDPGLANCEIIDLLWLRNWDFDAVARSVRKTGRLLVAHEDRRFLGLGAEISAVVSEQLFQYLKAPVQRLGGIETPVPVSDSLVEKTVVNLSSVELAIESLGINGAQNSQLPRDVES